MATWSGAIIPVTFDAVDLCPDDLSAFLQITQGLNETPEVRGQDIVIPYLAGQASRPRRAHALKIVLTGFIRGIGATETDRRVSYRTTMRYWRDTLFDPTRTAAVLAATLEDGTIASLDARPLSMIVSEQVPSEYADVSIELLSVTPDWAYDAPGS